MMMMVMTMMMRMMMIMMSKDNNYSWVFAHMHQTSKTWSWKFCDSCVVEKMHRKSKNVAVVEVAAAVVVVVVAIVVVVEVVVVVVVVVWGSYALLTNVILDYERGCKRLGPVVSGDESFTKVDESSLRVTESQNEIRGCGVAGDHFFSIHKKTTP